MVQSSGTSDCQLFAAYFANAPSRLVNTGVAKPEFVHDRVRKYAGPTETPLAHTHGVAVATNGRTRVQSRLNSVRRLEVQKIESPNILTPKEITMTKARSLTVAARLVVARL